MWLQFISDAYVQVAICSPMMTASIPPKDFIFLNPVRILLLLKLVDQRDTQIRHILIHLVSQSFAFTDSYSGLAFMRQVIMRR